jgi:glycosyltransferase involved in cell wall biosynthesis
MSKVSVLMPAYNAEKYIDEAIQSVVNQSLKDWELVVVNDGSLDGTWSKIQVWMSKDRRVKGFNNDKNIGLCRTLNRGIAMCSYEYIARLDSDDCMLETRLQMQSDFLDSNIGVGIVGGGMYVCDEYMYSKNERGYPLSHETILSKLFYYSPFCHPAVMYRKSKVIEAGLYNVVMSPAEDIDLWFRLLKVTKGANLDEVLIKYRILSSSESQSKARFQEFKTLYTRSKAVFEYGYQTSFPVVFYNLAQLISMFLLPQSWKFKIFNFFRK